MWSNVKLLNRFSGYQAQREKDFTKAPIGPLKDFLATPFPEQDTLFSELEILSVDFETTGLDPSKEQLLSVGFVNLSAKQIDLSTCYHQVIKTQGPLVRENVLIHQITDDTKARGASLEEVVASLLQALAGKVMLVHFAAIEKQFLAKACQRLYGMAPTIPIIDTLALAKRQLNRRNVPYPPSALRLKHLRQNYNLPEHFAHNALNDAIATAELLLAHVAHLDDTESIRLKDLLV